MVKEMMGQGPNRKRLLTPLTRLKAGDMRSTSGLRFVCVGDVFRSYRSALSRLRLYSHMQRRQAQRQSTPSDLFESGGSHKIGKFYRIWKSEDGGRQITVGHPVARYKTADRRK